jgi:hypothetical protein
VRRVVTAIAVAVALAAALAAPAGAAGDYTPGQYKGQNSQGRPVILTVVDGKVERYGFSLEITCTKDGKRKKAGGKYTNRLGVQIDGDGRFESKRSAGRYKPWIRGRVEGRQAGGTFKLTFKRGGAVCKSPAVDWQANVAG